MKENAWEAWQTFNPAALFENGKVHFLYRAIGEDGVSRLGYASSTDGIHIDDRSAFPAYMHSHNHRGSAGAITPPDSALQFISGGGGWGGSEDPRLTRIGDRVYLLYVAFDGATPPRIALTSISLQDFLAKRWRWDGAKMISSPGVVDKSSCLFPEKIGGKYVIMHRIFPNILIDFVDDLNFRDGQHLKGEFSINVREGYWDSRKIGAGAPPIKTKYGWLLIYYGVDDRDASQYKIGAMLLDLKNPTKVLCRTNHPILEPIEWYENEGHKAGVAYPCGAAVVNEKLFVYYGGADTVVCAACADLEMFLQSLIQGHEAKLKRIALTSDARKL